ncbi:MAG: glycoside hydrolase family 95 protein [Acidobacteriaceae bacterium]|nr:glycoside hydrolase family 95 protein [Acidobacteriaceae bacterium]
MRLVVSMLAVGLLASQANCAWSACAGSSGAGSSKARLAKSAASKSLNRGSDAEVPLRLWYDKPAANDNDGWVSQSLPLGNGYMGVNLFGGVQQDRLQITENSLVDSPADKIGGLNNFAEVFLDFPQTAPKGYSRDLVLNSAVAHVRYENSGVHYERDYFTSYPDKVLVVRLSASKEGALDFTLRPTIPYIADFRKVRGDNRGKHGTVRADGNTIILSGTMEYYGIKFEGQFKVIPQGGTLKAENSSDGSAASISVKGANRAVILVAVGTNYPIANPQVFSEENRLAKLKGFPVPHRKVSEIIASASEHSYDELLERHEKDYGRLYGRVDFSLDTEASGLSTNELIEDSRAGKASKYLDELAFQYGRYLLISSSRAGTLPPNLQGVWNVYQDPPWTAGYWHNVNEQMNYWLAFNTNLPELFDSYIDFYRAYLPYHQALATKYLKEYHPAGLARDGDNGWALGNGMRPLEPSGKTSHSGFGTGPWTAMLFWDDYDFTRNKKLLQNVVYPAMRGQTNFLSRFVQDVDGKLLANPSSSPENASNLQSIGTTFDQQMIYENFRDTIEAARVLGIQDPLIPQLKFDLPRLDPILIGDSGQIKEYREETTYGSIGDPKHRHMSQLLGLYPGQLINSSTPAWLNAAKVSLNGRGIGNGIPGWADAQRLATWARTGDGDRAYEFYEYWLSHHAMYNLWNNHPDSFKKKVFQIDANLGVTAGVAELLLQSNEEVVVPLPALPHAWPNGSYRGLLARGAFEVSADWENGHAKRFEVLSKVGGLLKMRYPKIALAKVLSPGGEAISVHRIDEENISIDTTAGDTYIITSIP